MKSALDHLHNSQTFDSLIIGGGPTGLAIANDFCKEGLSVLVCEKGPIGNHIQKYPTFMRFFSTRDLVEIDDFPFTIPEEKPSRQQYLTYLLHFARNRSLPIQDYTEVTTVQKLPSGFFEVELVSAKDQSKVRVTARSVVVACGAFESPRSLDAPGQDLPKVTSFYKEPHPYIGHKVLVVGGRGSAVETALGLWRAGAEVSLSYRRESFEGRGLKYWLKPDIENRIKKGEITGYLGTTVQEIKDRSVTLRYSNGEIVEIENDFVISQIGYEPPVAFLERLGIEVDSETKVPAHSSETLESNIEGLYLAGVIIAGNISGNVFIENSRGHGKLILQSLLPRLESLIEA